MKNKTFHKKKILVVFLAAFILILYLIGRLVYLMVFDAEYYQQKAEDLHERSGILRQQEERSLTEMEPYLQPIGRYVRFL